MVAPAPGEGAAPPARKPVRRQPAPRTFVPGVTVVEGPLMTEKVPGFQEVEKKIRKAPLSLARLDFEVSPPRVRPGVPYAVKVYLLNQGKRPIALKAMSMAMSVNGRGTSAGASPRTQQVAPGERAFLHEARQAWRANVVTWSLEVVVTAGSGDTYKNQLVWK